MSVRPAQRASSGAPALERALEALADDGWTVLHRLRWPGRLQRPVDLALVGAGGVLVVDVRSWSGAVVDDGVLRVGRRTRAGECRAAAQAGAAVATLLHAEHRSAVRAVLCLTGTAVPVAPLASGALVLAAADLHRWACALPARLDDDEVRLLAAHLRWQLGGPADLAERAERAQTAEGAQTADLAVSAVADDLPDAAPAVVVPVTRRALREAERLAERQGRRGVLGRQRVRRTRASAPAPAGAPAPRWPSGAGPHSQPTPSPSRSSLRL